MVRHTLVMRALLAAGLALALTPVSAQDKAAPEKPIRSASSPSCRAPPPARSGFRRAMAPR